MSGPFVRLAMYDYGGIPVAWLSGDHVTDRAFDLARRLARWLRNNRDVNVRISVTFHDEMDDPLGIVVLNDEQVENAADICYQTLNGTHKLPQP